MDFEEAMGELLDYMTDRYGTVNGFTVEGIVHLPDTGEREKVLTSMKNLPVCYIGFTHITGTLHYGTLLFEIREGVFLHVTFSD